MSEVTTQAKTRTPNAEVRGHGRHIKLDLWSTRDELIDWPWNTVKEIPCDSNLGLLYKKRVNLSKK